MAEAASPSIGTFCKQDAIIKSSVPAHCYDGERPALAHQWPARARIAPDVNAMKKHFWLAALALIAPFKFIEADAGPSITDATLACALTLLPADFFDDGPLGMPSASSPFMNSDYSLIRSKASGPINKATGAATVAIGAHVNGSSNPAIVILYSGWVNHLQYDPNQSPPYTSLTALKPYIALNTHNATTAKELGNAFMNSSAFCGLLAAVFYHEALHAKLGSTPADQDHAVLTCEHIAIIHTAAKKACDRAGQI